MRKTILGTGIALVVLFSSVATGLASAGVARIHGNFATKVTVRRVQNTVGTYPGQTFEQIWGFFPRCRRGSCRTLIKRHLSATVTERNYVHPVRRIRGYYGIRTVNTNCSTSGGVVVVRGGYVSRFRLWIYPRKVSHGVAHAFVGHGKITSTPTAAGRAHNCRPALVTFHVNSI